MTLTKSKLTENLTTIKDPFTLVKDPFTLDKRYNNNDGSILSKINNMVAPSISSDRSIFDMSIIKNSKFLRYTNGISLFIRQNWKIIRLVLVAVGVILMVMIVLPAIIAL
jgi:hypothetical protein